MTRTRKAQKLTKAQLQKKRWQDERKLYVWAAESPTLGPFVFVPGYTLPSLANARLHWRSLATIKVRQKDLGRRMARLMHERSCINTAMTVTLRRVGVRLLDDDNLASAFKHIRDGIAAEFGVDDGPSGPIVWRYEQATGKEPGIDVRWSA